MRWFATSLLETRGIGRGLLFLNTSCIYDKLCCSDGLDGTFAYGTYSNSLIAAAEFSVPFSQYVAPRLRVLFITGDQSNWLVARYEQIALDTAFSGAGSRYRPIASSALVYDSNGRIDLGLGYLPFSLLIMFLIFLYSRELLCDF